MKIAKITAIASICSLVLLGGCGASSQATDLRDAKTGTCWNNVDEDSATGTSVDCSQSHTLEIIGVKDFSVQGDYDQKYLSEQTENFCNQQLPAYAPEGFNDFESINMFIRIPTEKEWNSSNTVTGLCGVSTEEPTTGHFSDQ